MFVSKRKIVLKMLLVTLAGSLILAGALAVTYTDTSQSDFDAGDYNQTESTADGNIILSIDSGINYFSTGDFNSRKIDAGSDANWQTLLWHEGHHYGEQLPDNNSAGNQPDANMTGNVLLMHFNDKNASNWVLDASGINNDGELIGNADTNGTGRFDTNSLYLDGTGDYVLVGDHDSLSPLADTNEMTIALWINANTANANDYLITKGNEGCTGCWEYALTIGNSNTVLGQVFKPAGGGLYSISSSANSIQTDTWTFVTFTVDHTNTTAKIYINGKLETTGSNTSVGNPSNGVSDLAIGRRNGKNSFDGLIDETAIWNRVLDQNEIWDIYRRGAVRLKFQVRSCADSTCSANPAFVGPDGTANTYFHDGNTPHDLNVVANNRYFQYRSVLETDDVNSQKETTAFLMDVNIDYTASADSNITRIESAQDNQPLPYFSYSSDSNLTIDFNVAHDKNNLLVDLNYSGSNSKGTGTIIVKDLNLSTLGTSGAYKCADTNFEDSTQCTIDWNISSVEDGNYFLLLRVSDGSLSNFNASDNNVGIDNTNPSVTITSTGGDITNIRFNFNYTGSDAKSGIQNYWVSGNGGTSWINNGLNTSYAFIEDPSQNLPFSRTYSVIATDNADNNSSAQSVRVTFQSGSGHIMGTYCGNNVCEPQEKAGTCPNDCTAICGDLACTHTENFETCPIDCGIGCGNKICETSETIQTCPIDCDSKFVEIMEEHTLGIEQKSPENILQIQRILNEIGETNLEKVSKSLKAVSVKRTFANQTVLVNNKIQQQSSIKLMVLNQTNIPLQNIEIIEYFPKTVAIRTITSEIPFETLPLSNAIRFTVPALRPYQSVAFSYTLANQLTRTQAESFKAPFAVSITETTLEKIAANTQCQENADCKDANLCTANKCLNGICFAIKLPEEERCDVGAVCRKGVCTDITQMYENTSLPNFDPALIAALLIVFVSMGIVVYEYSKKP